MSELRDWGAEPPPKEDGKMAVPGGNPNSS